MGLGSAVRSVAPGCGRVGMSEGGSVDSDRVRVTATAAVAVPPALVKVTVPLSIPS